MPKIYYIANARMPSEKSHAFQIAKMCQNFSREGAEVTLVLPRRLNHIKESLFSFYGLTENFKIKKLPTIDLVFIGRLGFFIQSLSFALWVKFFLKIPADAVIYSRDRVSSFFLTKKRNKTAIEIHDEVKPGFIWKKVLTRANLIISTNDLKRKQIMEMFGIPESRTVVFPNGADLEDFDKFEGQIKLRQEIGLPTDKILVGYMGKFKTMNKEKGIREIIEAVPQMPVDVSAVFIGGSEKEIEFYKAYAEKLGVSDRTIFFGHKPQREIPMYLKSLDILLMPFPKTRHYEFAMSPIKMFEYMASKRPIIASDLPSIREVLNGENAFFVNPESLEELPNKVQEVVSNFTEAERRAENAYNKVKESYTWQNRAKGILIKLQQ